MEPTSYIATALTAAPALSMALGSAAVRLGVPSDTMQARLQNLSAGLLIGALLAEIYPMLHERLGSDGLELTSVSSAFLGFVLALGLMYYLHSLEHGLEEKVSEGPEAPPVLERMATAQMVKLQAGNSSLNMAIGGLHKMQEAEGDMDVEELDEHLHHVEFALDSMRRLCYGFEVLSGMGSKEARLRIAELLSDVEALQAVSPCKVIQMEEQLSRASTSLRRLHAQTHATAFRRWGLHRMASASCQELSEKARLPWGLVIAVAIDAAVDGMLIGLSTSTSVGAGMLMAIATFIEMGFLGYSFGCAVSESKPRGGVKVSALALPPLCLLTCGVGAFALGAALQGSFVFTGLISFSLVAVLFLVIQELILEAAEKDQEQRWNVSIFIYMGLFISFGLEVVL